LHSEDTFRVLPASCFASAIAKTELQCHCINNPHTQEHKSRRHQLAGSKAHRQSGKKIIKIVLLKDVSTLHGKPGWLSHLAVYRQTGQSNCISATMLQWKRRFDQ